MPQRANPDPLDVGKPNLKRWEEFRAQYSAALLTHWVFRDLIRDAADVVEDLWSRLQSSLNDYPELIRNVAAEQGEEWDGYVPFHGRDPKDIDWRHVDDLAALYESLFPHDLHNASIQFAIAGAIVVGLHSALESYTKRLRIDVKGGLVNAIRDRLSRSGEVVAADLVETLDDCDATRHVIVHNRGCVDEAYIRRVRNSPFQVGELRLLSGELIDKTRVQLKHNGVLPSRIEVEGFRASTAAFFDENTPLIFGLEFSAISLAHLISSPSARENMLAVDGFITQHDSGSAVEHIAIAFAHLVQDYERQTGFGGREPYIRRPSHRDLDEIPSRELKPFLDDLMEAVDHLRQQVASLSLGLDIIRLRRFHRLTPAAFLPLY